MSGADAVLLAVLAPDAVHVLRDPGARAQNSAQGPFISSGTCFY